MRTLTLPLAAVLMVSLAACGGDPEPEATPTPASVPAGTVEVVGTGSVAWADDSLEATIVDGSLALTLTCDGAVPHNVLIEGVVDDAGDDRVLAECSGDDSVTVDVEVEPGTLTFYCNVPGHRAAGMEGVINALAEGA